ncbi:triphosphate tunel metalloenzyme [Acrasis kona]|uniref:Triphosphate tunel metalloenzyme n=1 Tax=Acrasis kona TaxID=1008807 RepID=A0AAW2Z2C8_9EUKA
MIRQQEVEIKLTLKGYGDYRKLLNHLGNPKSVEEQSNEFYDGSNKEIHHHSPNSTSKKGTFRIRFIENDKTCVVTHKGKGIMTSGVNSSEETEEHIGYEKGKDILKDASLLDSFECDVVKHVKDAYQVKHFISLGGFKNHRSVYPWEGHKLEVDNTKYAFGENFEIEVETNEPDTFKSKLESFLDGINVSYTDSKRSKFANFINNSFQ